MPEKRPVARLEQGYVKIQLVEAPGCVARAGALLAAILWVAAWFGAGFVVGALVTRFF